MTAQNVPFRKMNGLGNAFAIFDARNGAVAIDAEAIRALGQDSAIGFDQMITLEPSETGADAFMRIHNRDGGEVDACGNATRCVGQLLMEESGKGRADIDTNAGRLHAFGGDAADTITVDMGTPRFRWDEIPLASEVPDTDAIDLDIEAVDASLLGAASAVNMGNPHVIFWVDNVEDVDLGRIGPMLEHHSMFPERANVSLAHVSARDAITVRTWERGVGLTKACGTAACAAAVAAVRRGFADRKVVVTLPGGPLTVAWRDDNHVWMTGPVEFEFEGTVNPETRQWSVAGRGAA